MTLLIIMFYRQKLYDNYSQEFQTLFQEWRMDIQNTKENEEKLAVGFRLRFKITLL